MKKIALFLVFVLAAGVAFAATAPKDFKMKGKKGDVPFSHEKHLGNEGIVCKTCHPSIFKMKIGKNKSDMAAINKGKACGVCHKAGGKAFAVAKNCNKCHVKPAG